RKPVGRAAEQAMEAVRQVPEERRGPVREERIVAREQLVAAVAGQRDLHAASSEAGQKQRGQEARIRERLVEGGDRLGQEIEARLSRQPLRGVLGAEPPRREQGVRRLVEALLGKSDRERLKRILVARGKRRDGG